MSQPIRLTWVAPAGVASPPPAGPPPPPTPPVGPGTITFSDFTANGGRVGKMLPATGYTGNGIGVTVLEMVASSSTKAALVPAQSTGSTNPLQLLRTFSGNLTVGGVYSGFTLQGTAQGHLYNGLMIDHELNPRLSDLLINGIPGDNASNPGETFGVNLYGCNGAVLTRVEVDGRLGGVAVGASGVGWNTCTDATMQDCYVHDHAYGMPTFWETHNITTHNLRSINNHLGINHERPSGVLRHYNPVLSPRAGSSGLHFTFNSDLADTPDIEVHDPVVSGGVPTAGGAPCVLIGHTYRGLTQRQTSLPRFYRNGVLMSWADAGCSVPGYVVASANMAAARADPQHWVVRFH